MRKPSEKIVKEADEVIEIESLDEIDSLLDNIALRVARAIVKRKGWYGFKKLSGKKILIVQV